MTCPKCQTSNPAEARFCMSCGSALVASCPNCQTEQPPEAQFCFKCGHRLAEPEAEPPATTDAAKDRIQQYIPAQLLAKLESARASGGMQGERRVVTMLFCDVQNSTAAAEGLDPEEWAEIINGGFEHLIAPVYRYEGTLARLMGDAILAFFGAPIGHEDDPQRAVLAGLDIVEGLRPYREEVMRRWGLDFDVRVGINTGLVVVGEVGSDLRVEYTAMGDAVNLASRMEQTAAAGTVQITEQTYRQVAPLFDVEDLGTIEVKGKSEPVRVYRALRPKVTPGSLRGIDGLEAPLIGRAAEMGTLRDAVDGLLEGRGQLVSVMGEAGLGKSRLMAELRKALVNERLISDGTAAGPELVWCEGRSLSYETATPYAPFAGLLSGYLGLPRQETDGPYAKLREAVAGLVSDRVSEVAPFIASLLGIDVAGEDVERVKYLQPPQLREGVFRAVSELVTEMAGRQPLVLVFEDLHWTDPTSLDLIERLMPLTDRAPVMMICLFRPWRQEPSWRFHEVASRDHGHRYTSVTLAPLGEGHSRELVANLLEVEDLPDKVRALILTKAEGNPFFVEEVIRSLLDARLVVRENSHWRATREIEDITVPDSLAGVIMARLDQLDESSKRVVQTASVIGREFQFDTLANVHGEGGELEEALTELQRRELVREKSRLPQRVYMFKHALTQETAYASLLLSTRRQLHRRAAGVLERTDAGRVTDIARHCMEAREEARALPYLVEAADRAARAYSGSEAIGFYRQALEVLESVEEPVLARRAYEGRGGVLTFSGDVEGAMKNYHQMYHAAEKHGDGPMQVSALNKMGYVTALLKGEVPEAEEHLVDAERVARECGDRAGLAEMHMTYCYIRTATADFADAEDHLRESAQLGAELDLEEPRLFGLTHTAATMVFMTRFDEAWEVAEEARELAEKVGNRKYLAELLSGTVPLIHIRNGDLDAARQSAEEALALSEEIGATETQAWAAFALGQIASLRGEYEAAIESQSRALHASEAPGVAFVRASAMCALGTAYIDISTELAERANSYHDQAMELMRDPLASSTGAISWAEIGFCALAQGNLETASELFEKGLTTPTTPMHLVKPRLLLGSALVALQRADLEAAAGLVEDARGLTNAASMKHYDPWVEFVDGLVSGAMGDAERALAEFTRSEEAARQMQMRPLVWQARAGAAGALYALGRPAEAEAARLEAQETIDEIAALFADDELRRLFVESAMAKLSGAPART